MKFFESIQSYRRRTNVMARCRFPEFCERYKKNNGMYDPKGNRILPRIVKQRDICVHFHKNHFCVVWKKNGKDSSLNGVEEIKRSFE